MDGFPVSTMSDNETRVHFRAIRFINEAGMKLNMKPVPMATAAVLYHRFFRDNKLEEYDPYLIATTALHLANKVEDENIRLRDIVNVSYRTLHRTRPPLEMGELFWSLKDTVVTCELLMLRSLQFKAVVCHPHRYLLHYLKFLKDWFEPYKLESLPISRTCWGILRDSYHTDISLRYRPNHIAIAVIYLTLLSLGVEVPYNREAELPWWKVLSEDISTDTIKDIINEIIYTYDLENTIQS